MKIWSWVGICLLVFGGGMILYGTHVERVRDSEVRHANFGGVSLRIEYADTPEERERGLGGRASIPTDYGMLFVFPQSDYHGFWMKDTLVPLDIFWLDDKGQVVFFVKNVAPSTYPNVLKPTIPARYVLETAAGFADLHSIATSSMLGLQSLPTVFK